MMEVFCVSLLICCSALIVEQISIKKQIKALRSDYESLANFSLKHIQEKQSDE